MQKINKVNIQINTNQVFKNKQRELIIEKYFLYVKNFNELYMSYIKITNKPSNILAS